MACVFDAVFGARECARWAYQSRFFDAAECLRACFGLAKNPPFADGNKRTAFLALGLSLRLNGYRLIASQPDATQTIVLLAAGEAPLAN
ncbi:MAG: Fic family protein [Burkholderiales bacterium]|nr:Fic family protein [Burkholderiales bacterium]